MNKLPWMVVVLLSIPIFIIGVLSLIVGTTRPGWLLVGLVLLALGAVLLISGLRRLRRLAEISPEALKTEAVELARRLGGDLTVSQFRAEYRLDEKTAVSTLEALVAAGTCKREQREERAVYVFTGLLPAIVEKLCPYCGTKLPVRSALRKCPNCGAQLELTKT